MRKKTLMHISECCETFVKKKFLTSEGYAARLFFSEQLGPQLSKYAKLVKISRDCIYVSVSHPAAKNEIMLLRRKLIKTVNEFLGRGPDSKSKITRLMIVED